ncbi:MAG: hypothetical protein ACK5MT_21540 [Actinomycetales bacterium]
MSISSATIKVLWSGAHGQCSFRGCPQELVDEATDVTTGEKHKNPVGEQAHIRSPKPGGPRHDPEYPVEKLDSYENLILLCPTHHTMVDANNGANYTVGQLVQMRKKHEQWLTRREQITKALRAYVGQQYQRDDKVLFEQVDLNGPSVDSMFVDVPFACRSDVAIADVMQQIAEKHPADREAIEDANGQIVTGAAQALLHPDWTGNALLVGGPGQGKSTLLQYVCQFHRARMLNRDGYTGEDQSLTQLTQTERLPIRLDLRDYASWATRSPRKGTRKGKRRDRQKQDWPLLEEFIAAEIKRTGRGFEPGDLAVTIETKPVLVALDGLDEVANLKYRERVSQEIVNFDGRWTADAADMVILVATRPGATTSALWSSTQFPRLNLQKLSHGLRLMYLQRWAKVARLSDDAKEKLQRTFTENENVPHVRELASYPMQLAILLHLLHRRGLLPQRRTELYADYLKTFLDREQTEDKEPLLAEQRDVIEATHAYIGWYIQTRAEQGKSSGSIKRDELKKVLRECLADDDDGQRLADELFTAYTSRVLCLVERDKDWFQFDVQSLREYFTATYIFDEGKRDARDDYFTAMLRRPYWSNVCRFYVGKYSPAEVRDIRHLLQELSNENELGLHPMLRSTAALFLNDRTYERQKPAPIQEIVDFILDGPGVVLAEDGLLTGSGSALVLSERAGRTQVVRHVKDRLEAETDPGIRRALQSSLRRHSVADDKIADWWWTKCDTTWEWFTCASRIGALDGLTRQRETMLAEVLTATSSEDEWATSLLLEAGYQGSADEVLSAVVREINDGAGETVRAIDLTTPVGRLLRNSAAILGRAPRRDDKVTTPRTRLRGKKTATVLAAVVEATDQLQKRPAHDAAPDQWGTRLAKIAEVWHGGWVLQQAVVSLPIGVDIAAVAKTIRPEQAHLAVMLNLEAEARAHRNDTAWWRAQLSATSTPFATRHWLFSVLSCAHTQVVVDLAAEISETVDRLAPKHYRSLRTALVRFQTLGNSHKLVLYDPLRLNQVNFSPATLWLLRTVVTEASADQIDQRFPAAYPELLDSPVGDLRELTRFVGASKTIPFNSFRDHRAELPVGGWASDIKLGAMRGKVADEVLANPAAWPGDLVQRAVERVEECLLVDLEPLAEVADNGDWFTSD